MIGWQLEFLIGHHHNVSPGRKLEPTERPLAVQRELCVSGGYLGQDIGRRGDLPLGQNESFDVRSLRLVFWNRPAKDEVGARARGICLERPNAVGE